MQHQQFDLKSVQNHISFQNSNNEYLHTYMQANMPLTDSKDFEFTVRHSRHSLKRASQRSFNYHILLTVLLLGTPFYRQGMIFYTIMRKDIPDNTDNELISKTRDLVVVLGHNSAQVVTCYYANNAVKYLRRKGKELKK